MKYKLVAVDLDGTLLNNNKEITDYTRESIRKSVEKGTIFTFSTGRPIASVTKYSDMLNLDVPIITYNGAKIEQSRSHTVIFNKLLNRASVQAVFKCIAEFDTNIVVWSDDQLYVNRINERITKYRQMHSIEPIVYNDEYTMINKPVTKMLLIDDPKRIRQFIEVFDKSMSNTISYTTSSPDFLEIVEPGVSKASALTELCNYFGITKEEIIAIGDGNNDLSMIEYAGMGIAMENACDVLKNSADYITLSNENDGVAHALEKFILNA